MSTDEKEGCWLDNYCTAVYQTGPMPLRVKRGYRGSKEFFQGCIKQIFPSSGGLLNIINLQHNCSTCSDLVRMGRRKCKEWEVERLYIQRPYCSWTRQPGESGGQGGDLRYWACLLCAPNKYSLFYQQNKFPFWALHLHKWVPCPGINGLNEPSDQKSA